MAYVELELKGSAERAVGFVEGFRAARGDARPVWYCNVEGVGREGLLETLREKLGRASHVVAPEDLAQAVAAAVAGSPAVGLEVAEMQPVGEAELEVEARSYTRELAAELRGLLVSDLPGGVRIEGVESQETVDEGSRGTEMYAPSHHYTVVASGRYVGPVEGVLAVAARLEGRDFVRLGKVRLHRA